MKTIKLLVLVMVLCLANVSNATLLVHYTLDETSGTVADDTGVSGNFDGALSGGATFVTGGKYGNAASFTSSSASFITVSGDTSALPSDTFDSFTASLWVNPTSWTSDQVIFCYTINDVRVTLGITGGYLVARTYDFDAQAATLSVGAKVSDLTIPSGWNHLAVVITEGSPTLYLNGTALTGVYGTTYGWNTTADLGVFLGKRGQSSYKYYTGLIDDFALLGEALTASEVAAIYNSTTAIPEPATIALLMMGFGVLSLRKKK